MLWLYILTEHERGTAHTGHESKTAGEMPVPPRTDVRHLQAGFASCFGHHATSVLQKHKVLLVYFVYFGKRHLLKNRGLGLKLWKMVKQSQNSISKMRHNIRNWVTLICHDSHPNITTHFLQARLPDRQEEPRQRCCPSQVPRAMGTRG